MKPAATLGEGARAGAHDAWRPGWLSLPVAALGVVLFYPLALMSAQAFTDPDGGPGLGRFIAIVRTGLFIGALFDTVRIAFTATALCVALGFTLAILIRFVPFVGARALSRLIDAYLAFPSFLVALSLTFLYGNAGIFAAARGASSASFLYGFWGVVLAEVSYYTPFVMRPLLAALDTLDHAQLEAAGSLGETPVGVLRRIVLPATLPALLAGASLCLLLTINEFGIILVMGVKDVVTLPMLIYGKAIEQFDYAGASVVALCNIALSLGLYFACRRLVDRLPT